MSSKGDEEFLDHAIARGFLREEDRLEIWGGCCEMAVALKRPVPMEHFVLQHGWLRRDIIDRVCEGLHRRVMLCPSCWTRLNVFSVPSRKKIECSHCRNPLEVPADRHAEVLLRPGDATRTWFKPNSLGDLVANKGDAGPKQDADVDLSAFELPDFEVLDRNERGAMSVVFKAQQLQIDRIVAVKVLKYLLPEEHPAVRRFFREARALGRIEHPTVAHIHYAGCTKGFHYMVMDWVEGKSLAEMLEERGPLLPVRALGYAAQAAHGLAAIHAQGLVHRDVKPSNIMAREDGTACVTDFGLVRIDDPNEAPLTRPGDKLGTPYYVSPEQSRDPHKAAARSDIYSLGATLFELLSGAPPFARDNPKAIWANLALNRVPRLDGQAKRIPEEAVSLVHRFMAPDPKQRPESMNEVISEIETALAVTLRRGSTGRLRPEDTAPPHST